MWKNVIISCSNLYSWGVSLLRLQYGNTKYPFKQLKVILSEFESTEVETNMLNVMLPQLELSKIIHCFMVSGASGILDCDDVTLIHVSAFTGCPCCVSLHVLPDLWTQGCSHTKWLCKLKIFLFYFFYK